MAIVYMFIALSLIAFILGVATMHDDDIVGGILGCIFVFAFIISVLVAISYIWDYNKALAVNKSYGTSYTANDFFYNEELTMKEINTRNHLVDTRNAIDLTVSQ